MLVIEEGGECVSLWPDVPCIEVAGCQEDAGEDPECDGDAAGG